MQFVEVFIRRPLLACVLNSLIVLGGLLAFDRLDLRPYPEVQEGVIVIQTAYPGATADLVQGFVTGPIQRGMLGAEGISYYSSSTYDGLSLISVFVKKGYDIDQVMTEVVGRIAGIRSQLPETAEEPLVTKESGMTAPIWLMLGDSELSPEQLTEFFNRVLRPRLLTTEGVATVEAGGARPFAMRIWLDPVRMAAFDVVSSDIQRAIQSNNFISEAGELEGAHTIIPIRAETDLNTAEAFANMVVREQDNTVIRLGDVAEVELASEPVTAQPYNGSERTVGLLVNMAPDSNPLELGKNIKRFIEEIQSELPPTMTIDLLFDIGEVVERSLSEVTATLFEALAIVAIIVLLSFGSLRAVAVMLIAVPLSLIGTFLLMWLLGYSLNIFTLLALVIAIGLVVDDAIVVVENIHRYIEMGHSPVDAAIRGGREVSGPVIAMSLTLVAVYLPIGFVDGLTGDLIREFVFTLAGAVVISGIIALTLSPMMSSRFLKPEGEKSLGKKIDRLFDSLLDRYSKLLRRVLRYRAVWVLMASTVIVSIPVLMQLSSRELVPIEDSGYIGVVLFQPAHTSENYTLSHIKKFHEKFEQMEQVTESFGNVRGLENGLGSIWFFKLKPWEQRKESASQLQAQVQQLANQMPGLQAFSFVTQFSPGSGGNLPPIQFVIKTTKNYEQLYQVSNQMVEEAYKSGLFLFAGNNLNFEKPELIVKIDRDKAGDMGINMEDIGRTLSALLGEHHVNRFSLEGESYKVIPRATVDNRFDRSWLDRYYVRTKEGESVPLSSVINTSIKGSPSSLPQFTGLNAATLTMVMAPGVSMQQAINFLSSKSEQILPGGYSHDFDGQSRSFIEEDNKLLLSFGLAVLVIYLFLVAQYESLRDPLVVLISVPMSICGALLFTASDIISLSLFSQVGLITLVGLISKHGILIVDFAKRLQEQGKTLEEAIIEAASVRLRPILMTTAAIVMAVLPLLFASGPGAVSRFHIGVVIAGGMSIGTLFTLFVLPVVYSYIATRRKATTATDSITELS